MANLALGQGQSIPENRLPAIHTEKINGLVTLPAYTSGDFPRTFVEVLPRTCATNKSSAPKQTAHEHGALVQRAQTNSSESISACVAAL